MFGPICWLVTMDILVFEMPLPLAEERFHYYGAFTLDVKVVLNENLHDILDGTKC